MTATPSPEELVERLEAVRSVIAPRDLELDGVWWCPCCKKSIGGSHVTFEEHCEFCGTYLSDCQPDTSAVLAAHEALDDAAALIRELVSQQAKQRNALDIIEMRHRAAAMDANFKRCGCQDCGTIRTVTEAPTP